MIISIHWVGSNDISKVLALSCCMYPIRFRCKGGNWFRTISRDWPYGPRPISVLQSVFCKTAGYYRSKNQDSFRKKDVLIGDHEDHRGLQSGL